MGADLEQTVLTGVVLTRRQQRAAAVHVADRIGTKHPHPDDETDPRSAGRQLAQDPTVRDELLHLLAVLGYSKEPS